MRVREAWHSPDWSVIVERRDHAGELCMAVLDRESLVGEFGTVEALSRFLRERYRLGLTELIED